MIQGWLNPQIWNLRSKIPILWPPDVKSWLIWKDPDSGEDWGQEVRGTTKDEMAGWHHRLNGHGFEWTLGVDGGQGDLACCGSCGRKELDMTEQLNWTEGRFCLWDSMIWRKFSFRVESFTLSETSLLKNRTYMVSLLHYCLSSGSFSNKGKSMRKTFLKTQRNKNTCLFKNQSFPITFWTLS